MVISLCSCKQNKKPLNVKSYQSENKKEEEVTPSVPIKNNDFKITLSFAGDMVLAAYEGQPGKGTFEEYVQNNSYDYFLSKVAHIFKNDDFTFTNLENVMSDSTDLQKKVKDYSPAFWFKSDTERIKILSESGVEGVTLNNNHTFDYGERGFRETANAVENAGMQYGYNDKIMYFEKQGFKISVVCVALWYSGNTKNAVNLLNAAKENSDYQIILFHGGTEKVHNPDKFKVDAAHALVDAGADLVVGSHPHVLQPKEVYNGVEIIYSLGNFCYGGSRYPENRTIIYQMTLDINEEKQLVKSSSQIIPCYVHTGKSTSNFQPAIVEDEAIKQQILSFMNGEIESPI